MSDERIRVMRVITRLNVGGPSYQAIFLTERLQDCGYDSKLLTGNVGAHEGSMEPLAHERGVAFTRVKGLGREISIRSDGLTVARVYREIKRFRPHIVHTHLAKAGAVGRTAAKLAGVPRIVHTYHGHVFRGYFSERKTRVFVAIERRLANWTDRIIVLNDDQRDDILGFGVGKHDQFRSVPLGLELEPFLKAEEYRGGLRRDLGIPDNSPVVGIVARLVPIKAHDLFLRAAVDVSRCIPDVHFVIVGDGELRESLQSQASELGFRVVGHPDGRRHPETTGASGSSVHFLGFRSDLPQVYADMDVVVVCSHNEGMPVAIIEALASARPVVATDVGAVRSLVTDNETGLLLPPGQTDDLAGAIVRQLTNVAAAERMGLNGRKHVYPRLSIDRLETDVRDLYSELIRGEAGAKVVVSTGAAR